MLEIENIEDLDMYISPNVSRKASDCLGHTNLTVSSMEHSCAFQLHEVYKECRICLDQTEDQSHVFISPCKCTGSLRYVHQSCFLRWLERQYLSRSLVQQRELEEQGIQCQICKEKVYPQMDKQNHCLKMRQIGSRVKNQIIAFIVLVCFALVIGASMGLVIYFMQNGGGSFGQDPIATSVLLCALAFLLVACGFIVYHIIIKYCLEVKSKLTSFTHRKKTVKPKNRKQVIPYRS